jgi:hypothetical protein
MSRINIHLYITVTGKQEAEGYIQYSSSMSVSTIINTVGQCFSTGGQRLYLYLSGRSSSLYTYIMNAVSCVCIQSHSLKIIILQLTICLRFCFPLATK